ncbi:ferritin-like domain-containing protein [Persicitalea jodogahamensis]|uniref:Ferritin-like domain-containing protein n=1 Tax=Persicitalea jodogahamensis TaxID=402147 RepID=A0A8J3D8H3_9BACT|nr:ferritin-like domain-containing protein [Persicitalea jodogahamensis]GHB88368.1 hypothetical protein GCM10007390_50600 [Persicitalea jodogahamensis]
MNIFKIIDEIQQVDGDAVERLQHASRRSFMTKFSRSMAAAAVPAAMGTIFNKAYAFTPGAIDVLKFALTLEYLEEEFYVKGTSAAGLIPAEYGVVFNQIKKHESQHVNFLKTALGAAAPAKPTFDFTAKGAFADVFTKFDTFVFLSHAFEDTGVRAYKGQAGNLMAKEDEPLLDYALQIHSVEARHAAKARYILSTIRGNTRIKPWISLNEGSPVEVYAGDDNTVQGGTDITGIGGKSLDAVTEAFDEPLTKDAVLAIAGMFIV